MPDAGSGEGEQAQQRAETTGQKSARKRKENAEVAALELRLAGEGVKLALHNTRLRRAWTRFQKQWKLCASLRRKIAKLKGNW